MTEYHWIEAERSPGDRWLCLVPTDEPNPWSMRRIASIYHSNSAASYVGAYHYPQSTGNKQSSGVFQKTRRGTQRWIERQLAKFWEPPTIINGAFQ